ncbi:MAG: hypothetical protein AB8V10_05310 [Francisella endosymbiont of Hyalomma asiaticum]
MVATIKTITPISQSLICGFNEAKLLAFNSGIVKPLSPAKPQQ